MLFLKASWPSGMSFSRCRRAAPWLRNRQHSREQTLGLENREIANSKQPCISMPFRIQSGAKLIPESIRLQLASTSKSHNVRRNCEI